MHFGDQSDESSFYQQFNSNLLQLGERASRGQDMEVTSAERPV
jgi:hypothetical protein